MYKLISCSDKQGVEKVEFMNELKENHPNMMGELDIMDEMFLFYWDDDSGKVLKSSQIVFMDDEAVIKNDKYIITTINSVYEFIRVEE